MSAVVWEFELSLAFLFFEIGMKTDIFRSCGHCWVFQICWHIECSTFMASSFRIWNSSTGIPSPPLALFIGMLCKAHLTSHSRMSGFRCVITPSITLFSNCQYLHHLVYQQNWPSLWRIHVQSMASQKYRVRNPLFPQKKLHGVDFWLLRPVVNFPSTHIDCQKLASFLRQEWSLSGLLV